MNDLRFAHRPVRQHPGFSAVRVLSLPLSIGAGTAVFSLVAALAAGLPVGRAARARPLMALRVK